MTTKKIIVAMLVASAAWSCQSPASPQTSPNEPLAAAKGRDAALEAASLPSGSMQQEKALLHIRAIEHRIRTAGDSLAADAYARAAESVLDSAGIVTRQ